MASEKVVKVVSVEKGNGVTASYTLSTGEKVTPDELKERLLAGESIEGVRLQRSGERSWIRLSAKVPTTQPSLATIARARHSNKHNALEAQLRKGFEEELSELIALI